MSDLISVIIPNYNNATYLNECINSVQGQTYSNLEILVIDDKSSDDSRTLINKLSATDSRINAIFNDRNLGIAANRHKGIMMSTGAYITTLDADDFLYDQKKIEAEHSIMKHSEKNSTIAFSNFILVNEAGKPLKDQGHTQIREGDLFLCILSRSCKIPRDFMFTKKQYISSGGLNPALKMYEDWDLKIRLSSRYEFVYTGISGIAYRRHQHGLSSVRRHAHYKWLKKIFRMNNKIFIDRITPEARREFDKFMLNNFDYRHKLLSLFVH